MQSEHFAHVCHSSVQEIEAGGYPELQSKLIIWPQKAKSIKHIKSHFSKEHVNMQCVCDKVSNTNHQETAKHIHSEVSPQTF